jgi:hypothetical protein
MQLSIRDTHHPTEERMKLSKLAALMAAAGSIATLVAGCGGGGGGGDSTPAATTIDVSTKVLDGAIANATVCLDRNDNGACDADESSGRSGADGAATLKVAKDDAGKFPLLALVDTDATDADHGAITSAYVRICAACAGRQHSGDHAAVDAGRRAQRRLGPEHGRCGCRAAAATRPRRLAAR